MKLQSEKPSENIMRFFTPELFVRFNSSDDEVADAADAEWECAIQSYRSHLNDIRERMPSLVKKIADICLHDAEFLSFEEMVEPTISLPIETHDPFPTWSAMGILSVRQNDNLTFLIYRLWDRIQKYPAQEKWPFAKQRIHWLYDEVDVTPNHWGTFFHRILLSDGQVLEIPFTSVVTHTMTIASLAEGAKMKQRA